MKQVTNEVYRTKKKLELLESEGIGQLLTDFSKLTDKYVNENEIKDNMELLVSHYKGILQEYKPSKQFKINFNE